MTIRVYCTHDGCGQRYKVGEERLGQAVVCKKCKRPFVLKASNRETVQGATEQSDTVRPAPPPVRRTMVEPPPLRSGPATTAPPTPEEKSPVKAVREAGVPEKIGRFEVLGWLGAGAFGDVYRARDPVLDREVALKVPHAATLQSETRRARVLTEAKAAAQLRHPNIVPVFEAAKQGDTYYIASAFIEGTTLEDAIDQRRPDFREAAKLVMDLAGALFYAHQRGVVHRDIKPANIMLDAQGDPLLMDFGLARLDAAESKLTHDGTVLGTPSYMAPEQAGGHLDRIGSASDQYSLGVVLYELLCGSTPFSGPPAMVISLVLSQEPDSPRKENPAVPKDLETICLKAMAKEPENRYASCRAMAEDLRRWLTGEPITARRVSPAERLVRWCRRNPVVAGLAGTAAALLLTVAVVASTAYVRTSQALARADAEWERAELALGQKTTAERGRLTAEELVQTTTERIETLETALKDSETKLGEAEGKLGDTESKLGETETKLGETQTKLKDRDTKLSETEAKLSDTQRKLAEAGRGLANAQPQDEISIDLGGGVSLEMVLIPAGEFMMGSPDSDPDAPDNEKPQHRVRITRPFYLGKYPVTQEQWEAVMGNNPSHFKGPENPVERVSWNDCQEFVQRLNERVGDAVGQFRLPTEAEWEYGCRAGTTTRYSFGDDADRLGEYAWYRGNSGRRTHPVGQKRPNAWGLYDMHGNVSEWCSDWFDGRYYAKSPVDDPSGPAWGSYRVRRGGSWDYIARHCRSAPRGRSRPVGRSYFIGFRLALVSADESSK